MIVAYNIKTCDREQMYLLPPSLKEWLPEGDLAWFLLDAVAQMDLKRFYTKHREDGRGGSAFDPGMKVALLLYAYCRGERSSRKIEELCEKDIGFRVIAGNLQPDHSTISRFRQENGEELKGLFIDVLRLCEAAGLVKVGVVALDGSKMKANGSLAANREKGWIEEEVKRMLAEAKEKDEKEDALYGPDRRGDELPDDLRERESRLARLKAAQELLKKEAEAAAAEQEAKIEARKALEAAGEKKRGRKPKETVEVDETAKANITDPESRIMKTRSGYIQGYNAQAVVTEEQIIVAAEVTQEANDVKQLHPMIGAAEKNLREIGEEQPIGAVLADAGYWSESNEKQSDPEGPELYVATNKDWKQRKMLGEQPSPKGRMRKDISPRDRMERKLLTKEGRSLYKKRGKTVEPVFGQIKYVRGFDRFVRRGIAACASEWKLICATHNLLKLWRSVAVVGLNPVCA
jgi:transposase